MRRPLAETAAERAPDHLLVTSPAGTVSAGEAAALGPAADLGAEAIALVWVEDVPDLVRLMLAFDGQIGAMMFVSVHQPADVVAALAERIGATVVICDRPDLAAGLSADLPVRLPSQAVGPRRTALDTPTTWLMTTSGTTGIPKVVPHTTASLARTARTPRPGQVPVFGLLYELSRYGGVQVALQAILGGGTLAAAPPDTDTAEQAVFLADAGCTHLSATPSLWRRLLMVPDADRLPLRQATLGGEIADQALLDRVAARFPEARITHIYGSTETGIAFGVTDRKAGFPVAFLEDPPGGIGLEIRDGLIWMRPPDNRRARYLNNERLTVDDQGFVLTGDRVEIRGDRVMFLGREGGLINVGGVKVWPEQVEAVIGAVPGVALAQVGAKRNPITGALLTATVLPADPGVDRTALRDAILAACRARLEREAVPARIAFTDRIETNAAGKISRT